MSEVDWRTLRKKVETLKTDEMKHDTLGMILKRLMKEL